MYPIRVGLIGTGYAAKARAESLAADSRAKLVAVAGRSLEKTREFCQAYGAEPLTAWLDLVHRPDIDLVIIASVNADHALMARTALQAERHVVVEYPLALSWSEAAALVELSQTQNRLLHVEHIELLSGIHLAVQQALPRVGTPFYVRYASLNSQQPAPQKWTYAYEQFGFPLVGALSRLHRLINLFGAVASVSCQAQYWQGATPEFFAACLCTAQLRFMSGLVADLVYGKGETIWQSSRTLEIQAEQGGILVEGEQGKLVLPDQSQPLQMGSRRGLFAKDTSMVLDHLTTGAALYVSLAESLYALKVADAAHRSANSGQTIQLAH